MPWGKTKLKSGSKKSVSNLVSQEVKKPLIGWVWSRAESQLWQVSNSQLSPILNLHFSSFSFYKGCFGWNVQRIILSFVQPISDRFLLWCPLLILPSYSSSHPPFSALLPLLAQTLALSLQTPHHQYCSTSFKSLYTFMYNILYHQQQVGSLVRAQPLTLSWQTPHHYCIVLLFHCRCLVYSTTRQKDSKDSHIQILVKIFPKCILPIHISFLSVQLDASLLTFW